MTVIFAIYITMVTENVTESNGAPPIAEPVILI